MSSRPWNPAVTVAAVIERDGRFLVIEEVDGDQTVFNQPAGHWEPGESLIEACSRETLEEAAHPFIPTRLVGIYHWLHPETGKTFLRFAFSGQVGAEEIGRVLDEGIVRALWLTVDELRVLRPRHRSPLVMRCVDDYLAGRSYPLELIAHVG